MPLDPKLQKVLQFYLPELFNHFRSVAEHRLPPAQFNVVKKILWPYSQTQDKLEYLNRLREVPLLNPMNELLGKTLNRVSTGEARLSTLLSGIEVDSEKLVQIFEKLFQSVAPVRLNAELGALGIKFDADSAPYSVQTLVSESRTIATPSPVPGEVRNTPQHDNGDFQRVGDFVAFFSQRRSRKKTKTTVVDQASALQSIDDETLKDFTEEATSLLQGFFQAVARLEKTNDDRSALSDIRISMRALAMGAKLLQIDRLAAVCQSVSGYVASLQKESAFPSPVALGALNNIGRSIQDFVTDKPISPSALDSLVAQLTSVPGSPALVEPDRPVKKSPPATPKAMDGTGIVTPTSSSGNHHWIDDVQTVLTKHYSNTPLLTTPVPQTDKLEDLKFDLTIEPPVEKQAPEVKPAEIKSETKQVVSPRISRSEEQESIKTTTPSALLNLMASNDLDADLDKIPMASFMDKLAEEPKNLSTGKRRVRRRIMKVKKTTPAKHVTEAVEGQYVIREVNFGNVDPEILEIFEQESRDYLRSFTSAIEKLSQGGSDNAIKELERTSHTLKSSARMLGFDRISGLAACLEIIAERFFEGEIKIDAKLITLLNEMVHSLGVLFSEKAVVIDSLIPQLQAIESHLGTPNILVRNLVPADAKSQLAVPVPTVDEKAAHPKGDYFTSTGVDLEIIQIFKEESANYLARMTAALTTLHADGSSTPAVKDIEKAAHSLRSSAKMLGFDKISRMARAIESIAEKTAKGTMPLTANVVTVFDASCALLKTLAEGTDVDIETVVQQLETLAASAKTGAPATQGIVASVQHQLGQDVVSSKPTTKAKKKKKKKQKLKFADVEIQSDPILKRLASEAEPLLDEMAATEPK